MGSLTSNPDERPRGAPRAKAPRAAKVGALPRGRWPKGATLELDATGIVPIAKGNMRAFVPKGWTRAVITDGGGKELKAFERSLREMAIEAMAKRGLACAVEQPFQIELAIYLPRPGGDFDAHGGVRAKARTEPWVKPDLDKLERAILDSLTGVVYDDDSRVTRVVKQKKFAGPGHDIGLWLRASVRPSTLREKLEWSQQEIRTETP